MSEATYAGASAAAIEGHYGVGNEFYSLWLDPTRTYSCALWADGDGEGCDGLEAAQLRKFDYLAIGAGAAGAERVLDVGCGWGGMLRRLVEAHGVGRAVGLTLSEAQHAHASAELPAGCEVRVENWADHQPEQPYDAIVSIGAFEHFADFGMGRAARLEAYSRFFERCWEWLPPGGRLALQTNVKGANGRLDRQMTRDLIFIARTIFPESEIPWASEILAASERRFDLVSARNDPDHYARTCRRWAAALRHRKEEAVGLVGEATVADYERYLDAAALGFERRHLGLARLVLARV